MLHKVVWQHMQGVKKHFLNRLRFDTDMGMSLWPHFLAHISCENSTHEHGFTACCEGGEATGPQNRRVPGKVSSRARFDRVYRRRAAAELATSVL